MPIAKPFRSLGENQVSSWLNPLSTQVAAFSTQNSKSFKFIPLLFKLQNFGFFSPFQIHLVLYGFIPKKTKKSLAYSFSKIYQQQVKVKACPICSLNLIFTL